MEKKDLILHLIGEMSNFILNKNPKRMVISLHQEEDGFHLAIIDNNKHTDEEVAAIERALNSEKRPELAGYYGAMTGHDLLGNARLDLLGWQIKHADVKKSDGGIKIDLWLGSDQFEAHKFNIPKKEE